MSAKAPILIVDGLLILACVHFANAGQTAVMLATAGATLLVMLWQGVLLSTLQDTGRSVRIERNIQPPHFVQAFCHISIYVYWGLYWNGVRDQVPLILTQLVFAFALDMLFAWSQLQPWRAGFGPLPIVCSINLFLWFKDEYFALQLGMIVIAYLSKNFLRWKRPDRNGHIFNPSAFPLGVACIGMLIFHAFSMSRGVDIIETIGAPPNMFEVIFLLGLIVQFRFRPVLVTLGTILAQWAFFEAAWAYLGMPISPSPVNISVFLALTFLVTDPSTSPRTSLGKFLYGITYGIGVYLICLTLRLTQQPSFVDKILMVAPVNLLVPAFDAIGVRYDRRINGTWLSRHVQFWRYSWVVTYALVFLLIVPSLKTPLPRPANLPIPRASIRTSEPVTRVLANKEYCRQIMPAPFQPFGFRSEIQNYRRIKEIYDYDGPIQIGGNRPAGTPVATLLSE